MKPPQTEVRFTIDIADIPDDIKSAAELKAKEAYVMTLLEHRKISRDQAANLLNVSQPNNGELLNTHRLNDEFKDEIQSLETTMANQGIHLTSDDIEGLQAYFATKPKWEEVYRRLANS